MLTFLCKLACVLYDDFYVNRYGLYAYIFLCKLICCIYHKTRIRAYVIYTRVLSLVVVYAQALDEEGLLELLPETNARCTLRTTNNAMEKMDAEPAVQAIRKVATVRIQVHQFDLVVTFSYHITFFPF